MSLYRDLSLKKQGGLLDGKQMSSKNIIPYEDLTLTASIAPYASI